jgi:hypothetical protein
MLYSGLFKRLKHNFYDRRVHSNTASTSLESIPPYAAIQARRQIVNQSTTVYCQVLIDTAESTGAMQIGKRNYSKVLTSPHIFRTLILLFERPKLYD